MRGRGIGRAAPQRGDLFRSRPPNTSRPPSLHVDDFVALETCGQQPTGPTGYNKISMRVVKVNSCELINKITLIVINLKKNQKLNFFRTSSQREREVEGERIHRKEVDFSARPLILVEIVREDF